jgi:hypothetical protein
MLNYQIIPSLSSRVECPPGESLEKATHALDDQSVSGPPYTTNTSQSEGKSISDGLCKLIKPRETHNLV